MAAAAMVSSPRGAKPPRMARLSPKCTTGLLEEGLVGQGDSEDSPLLEREHKPHFKVLQNIALREEPELNGERSREVLKAGSIIEALAIVTLDKEGEPVHWDHAPVDEACYVLCRADAQSIGGWAISRNPATDDPMLEPFEPKLSGVDGFRQNLRMRMSSTACVYFVNTVVFVNAVAIYWEIDRHDDFSHRTWLVINFTFALIYILEVALKLFAFGFVQYFESGWNCTDFSVTLVTLLADIGPFLGLQTESIGAICPVLRLLRLLRLAKVFKELGQLLKSFLSSLMALLWICVLMGLWFFVCACVCTVFIGSPHFMPDGAMDRLGWPGKASELRKKFSSIPESCFSLLELMTLEGWPEIVRPLMHYSPALMFFLISFIFVTAFVLLNLVTAVVVEKMLTAQTEGNNNKEAAEDDRREIVVCDLRGYMKELNKGEKMVHRKTITKWMEDPGVMLRLKLLDWDETLLQAACAILDRDGSGMVSITALTKIMGDAATKSLDTLTVLRCQADLAERIHRQTKLLDASRKGAPGASPSSRAEAAGAQP